MSKKIEGLKVNGVDADISADAINVTVYNRENAVDECHMTANNYEGVSYLNNIQLNDLIEVSFRYEDNPSNPWVLKFRGFVQELSPQLSKSGERISVVAYNVGGWAIKQMRVANEYGVESMSTPLNNRFGIRATYQGWTPFSNHYDGVAHYGGWSGSLLNGSSLSCSCQTYYIGSTDGDYYYYYGSPWNAVVYLNPTLFQLYLTGQLIPDTSGAVSTSVEIGVYVWDSIQGRWMHQSVVYISTSADVEIIDLRALFVDVNGNPTYMDMNGVFIPAILNNMKVRVELESLNGSGGSITLSDLMVDLEGFAGNNDLVHIRGILTDTVSCVDTSGRGSNSGFGIIPNYVNNAFLGMASGYSVGTDYIFNDTSFTYLYLYFPYEAAFDCLQELIKTACAARAVIGYQTNTSWAGLHWIFDNDGNLRIAPIGNHHVQGAIGKYADDIWSDGINAWTDHYIPAIVVSEDMIDEAFKTGLPLANYIIVAGKFIKPMNDQWTQATATRLWTVWDGLGNGKNFGCSPSGSSYFASIWNNWNSGTQPMWWLLSNSQGDELQYEETCSGIGALQTCSPVMPIKIVTASSQGKHGHVYTGQSSLRFEVLSTSMMISTSSIDFTIPLTSKDKNGNTIPFDCTKFISLRNSLNISFFVLRDSGPPVTLDIRFYRDINNYIAYSFLTQFGDSHESSGTGYPDQWVEVNIELTLQDLMYCTQWLSYFTDWVVRSRNGDTQWLDDPDFTKITMIGIGVDIQGGTNIAPPDFIMHINGFSLNGNTLRAAYDSNNIKQYGCRMITIKNSVAMTDNVDINDDSSPLAQNALYELLRHRLVVTEGTISVPLNPYIMAGQIINVIGQQQTDGSYLWNPKQFRVKEVDHKITAEAGAITTLKLTDDLWNSMPVDTTDPYSLLFRSISPDFQTKTFASLRTGSDYDCQLYVVSKDYKDF